MPRSRFLALLLTLAALHAALGARPVFAQAPPAPTLTSATADGTFVKLQWTLLPDARLSYRVEAGSAPGLSNLAVVDAGGFVSEFRAFNVPPGAYFVRVRTVLGQLVSAPSNELLLTVAPCPAQLPPLVLESTFRQFQTVWLSWRYATSPPVGCGAISYQVEAGSAPGAADIGARQITGFGGVEIPNVPFGTYYVRVRELFNGVPGAASNEVALQVACAAPPAIVGAQATVAGNGVQFTWNYGQSSAADFGMMLEAGSAPGAADLGTVPVSRLASTGLNAFGPAGTYFTRLRATNACGSAVSSEMQVTLTSACPVPGYIPFINAGLGPNGVLAMEWQRIAEGGFESSYRVEIGSAPGRSDLAQRVVDGRSKPELGFRETFTGINASSAFVRVVPLNSCGPGPSSIEVQTPRTCGAGVPTNISADVAGRRVSLRWSGTAEGTFAADDLLEIGTTFYASDVLVTQVITSPGPPGTFSVDLAPGRYYARVKRRQPGCSEPPVPSPEVSFAIVAVPAQ